jgi:hypothetical protein
VRTVGEEADATGRALAAALTPNLLRRSPVLSSPRADTWQHLSRDQREPLGARPERRAGHEQQAVFEKAPTRHARLDIHRRSIGANRLQ